MPDSKCFRISSRAVILVLCILSLVGLVLHWVLPGQDLGSPDGHRPGNLTNQGNLTTLEKLQRCGLGRFRPQSAEVVGAALVIRSGAAPSSLDSLVRGVAKRCGRSPLRAFVTYSDAAFEVARRRLVREAAASGDFDLVIEFTPQDIDEAFRRKNNKILRQPRGGGYWLWKPWAAARVAGLLRNGDFLVYLDAGCFILRSLEPWFQLAAVHDPGWVALEINEATNSWTKGDLFAAMDLDPANFTETKMLLAGVWVMRVSPATMFVVNEWLRLAQDERLLTDKPSVHPNPPGFREHRHDQAILSLLLRTRDFVTVLAGNTFPHDYALQSGALVSTARSRS
jgi:hypothetical protein